MPRISEEEIEAVRHQADIVDVIGHYLQVHKKGKSYVALCPFHDDHSPSMSISPDKQIYKCFVCGNGGNVFTFVQNYEKISYPEAVARVAQLIGYQLSVNPTAERAVDPRKEALYKVLQETIRYTQYQLNTSVASLQKEYLEGRGLDEKTCEQFEIGYNGAGDSLHEFLKAKGYEDKDMVNANVCRTSASGIHDVFSDRITFPIHDSLGNPIGFSARTMDPSQAKYINTNDTEVFHKGEIVYNYHRAKTAARRSGKVLVCEGVTDVIAFWKAGIENAVCTLGTSCTAAQIRLLKNIAPRTVFCYDGDDPGQAATYKAAKMARQAGIDVAIVLNETGLDPDEILRRDGAKGLQELAGKEISWMEFVLSYLRRHANFSSYLEKKEFVQKAMAEIRELDDEFDRRNFTDELAKISGFHLDYEPRKTEPIRDESRLAAAKAPDGAEQAEQLILALMMNDPAAVERFQQKLGFLQDPACQTLAMMIIDAYRSKATLDPAALIDSTQDQQVKDLITKLATQEEFRIVYDEKILDGAMRKVKLTILTKRANGFKEQLKTAMNPENRELALNEYQACLRELRRNIDEEEQDDSEED